MSVKFEMRGVSRLLGKLQRMPRQTEAEINAATERFGVQLLQAVRRHASGRPGPNVVTGQYLAAFYLEYRDGGAFVGNPSPQTRRLEYGFVGVDALGRVYNQPPYPHFGPALAEVRPQYLRDVAAAPSRAWRKL